MVKERLKEVGGEEKQVVDATLSGEQVLTEASDLARLFYEKSRFGTLVRDRVQLSLLEAFYLVEKEKLWVREKNRRLSYESLAKKAGKLVPNFWVRYVVFRDLRSRGYIVKTALKFGADFRVYDRGVKPGEDHAKWVVFPVHESSVFTWHDFSAKNRVAHSTKKRLLIGIVDDENDVTYYEIKWTRP